ncbi:MAG: molybdenum cofactor biosynthesis protein MoaE [Candidatus Hodarchaeales archaeon]
MTDTFQKGIIAEKNRMNLQQIIDEVKINPDISQAGDIVTFTGIVRETSIESDKKVTKIEIEAYDEPAKRELSEICEELIKRHDLVDARVVHFIGTFEIGESLVHCVIASKHRSEGFKAIMEMIEEYKHRAYIFKREIYTDGSSAWISKNKPTK